MTEIRKLGVIGAGQMGCGIAQVAAQAGIEVVLADASAQLAERGLSRIDAQLEKLVQKGKLEAAKRAAAVAQIHPTEGYGGFGDCDAVVEAIHKVHNALMGG